MKDIIAIGDELHSFIKAHGPVWAYGASTRGATLLQTMGLTSKDIVAIADREPSKHGTVLRGLDIRVTSEEEWRGQNPPYTLVLPWYFIEGFKEREKAYLAGGGKFIVPLPEFKIV